MISHQERKEPGLVKESDDGDKIAEFTTWLCPRWGVRSGSQFCDWSGNCPSGKLCEERMLVTWLFLLAYVYEQAQHFPFGPIMSFSSLSFDSNLQEPFSLAGNSKMIG